MGTASPAEAGKKNKQNVPGHCERSQDGGFEWVGKKKLKPKAVAPVTRDHRAGSEADGNLHPVARDKDKKTKKIIGVQ